MSRHRGSPVRPRYGRIAMLGVSVTVTLVAVLGGVGVIPTGAGDAAPAAADEPAVTPAAASLSPTTARSARPQDSEKLGSSAASQAARVAPPVDSGSGRRAVFSQSEQRVWLVRESGEVAATYLVSGSVTDNLDPGTYQVFSRSKDAVGIDGSTMRYFVRFTRGPSGAAIGFHDLPIDGGRRVQTLGDLGTAQSHGCIRQKRTDAKTMWRFAPLGTTVVVVA